MGCFICIKHDQQQQCDLDPHGDNRPLSGLTTIVSGNYSILSIKLNLTYYIIIITDVQAAYWGALTNK